MPKKLKPSTIIPSHLYVERNADRQLRTVVDEMGRPGYILVARQMGKTNLLINLMRQLDAEVVLYVDLSNRFDSARAWFRSVIDALLEARPDEFGEIVDQVFRERESLSAEPNVEYDRHLRLLLRTTRKRIIIVLDEIDSLVNASYSDTILAQIRSMYFSRVNHAEYERLTYVLSGVAEPTDLIKDRNISPFNIGEKIYLEDFSYSEFEIFLRKASLELPDDIKRHIYEWVGGNPRMTWDVCSSVEDLILAGGAADQIAIDGIVDQLYLRDFDRAPVDHIRTLVKSDPVVLSAISQIRLQHFSAIDDRVRSRLYLAGITKAGASGTVQIKNRIIEAALSDRWLAQLTSSQAVLLSGASAHFAAQDYQHAIRLYEEALANDQLGFSVGHRIELAFSYMWTGNLRRAAEEFQSAVPKAEDASVRQTIHFYLAVIGIQEGALTDAVAHLQPASEGPLPAIRYNSLITLTATRHKLGEVPPSESVRLLSDLIGEIGSADLPSHERRQLLLAAHYNRYTALRRDRQLREALADLHLALEVAEPSETPVLLLEETSISSGDRKGQLAAEVARRVIDGQLRFTVSPGSFGFTIEMLATALSRLAEARNSAAFNELRDYAAVNLFEGLNRHQALLKILHVAEHSAEPLSLLPIAKEIAPQDDLDPGARLSALRYLVRNLPPEELTSWVSTYLEHLEVSAAEYQENDVETINRILTYARRTKDKGLLEAAIGWWRRYEAAAMQRFPFQSVLAVYQEMAFWYEGGAYAVAKEPAERLLRYLEDSKVAEVFSDYAEQVRIQATTILQFKPPRTDPYKSFGRNQKVLVQYQGTSAVVRKFKQVESDLRSGRCVLLSPVQ